MLLDPQFPPLLTGHSVLASEDPLRVAMEGAGSGQFGAGDFCWSQAESHARGAIVLEPECSLAESLQMLPLLMVAIGDALGAIGPANLALMYRWPSMLLANGGEIGEVFLQAPEVATLDDVPPYIVLGFSISLSLPPETSAAPGIAAHTTALFEEGCGDLDRTLIIEAVARHFLSWVDTWEHDGFRSAHSDFYGRMAEKDGETKVTIGDVVHIGRIIGIDEDGGLLLDGDKGVRGISLAQGLGIDS